MKLGEFRKKIEGLDDNVEIAIAEVDEAAAMKVVEVDVVDDAQVNNRAAPGTEAIDLDGGKQKTVVLRY